MSSKHETLKDLARDAVHELFGDDSVSTSTTRQSLEEIKDDINDLLESLDEDEED